MFFLPIATPSATLSRTWLVTPDGTGDAPTIQAAIDLASHGDTIELADGTFTGTGNRDVNLLGKSILVRSSSDTPSACIIDVEGNPGKHRAFILQTEEQPVVGFRSLTISNGYLVAEASEPRSGGGIYCGGPANVTFENVVFLGNQASFGGAAYLGPAVKFGLGGNYSFVDCEFKSNETPGDGDSGFGGALRIVFCAVTFERCRFVGNKAGENAAVISANTGPYLATVTDCVFERNIPPSSNAVSVGFTNCAISNCQFLFNAPGCALYTNDITMTGCVFLNDGGGSGLSVYDGVAEITNCTFKGHSALRGGAMILNAFTNATIRSCHFEDNEATGTGSTNDGGGAIHTELGSFADINGCSFIGNSAALHGGAIFAGATSGPAGGVSIEGCTMVANSSPTGAGIFFWASTNTVRRTVIAFSPQGDAVACYPGDMPIIGCSNFFGNAGGDDICGADDGGNFSADPLFCNPKNGDYRLQWGSPCLPANSNGCGLVGRYGFGGCNSISIKATSWGEIKARYR